MVPRIRIWLLFICICLLSPASVFAQSEPGADPFALSQQQMSLFEGYQATASAGSLFDPTSAALNGFFTTPSTQLGGAAPYFVSGQALTQQPQTNVDTAQYIVLTSSYSPGGDLTKDSKITITVNVKNVSDGDINGIQLKAVLQDKNASLLADPAPAPPMKPGSSIASGLIWTALQTSSIPPQSEPFDLKPGASTSISWSVQPLQDNDVLRWNLTATFGAGESILQQWIPIKNPNPVASVGGGGSSGPGGGVNPCAGGTGSGPFPDSDTGDQIVALFKQHWNISLDDDAYSFKDPQFHGLLKAWWEVLLTVECTPYLTDAFKGNTLHIDAAGGGGGWWGEYLGNYVQDMWIANIANGTVEHIKQNLIHELGHVYEGSNPDKGSIFEANVCGKGSPYPYVSAYGAYGMQVEGNGCNESFAETMGYFVVRESNEWGVTINGVQQCASKNPFDWSQAIYYNFAKSQVFAGKEYGPPAPNPSTSC